MPELNPNLDLVGSGFAAFLSPPGPEVVRFTVGQPDFDTPLPVVDAAKAALDRGKPPIRALRGVNRCVKRLVNTSSNSKSM